MNDIILLGIQLGIAVAAFVAGRYLLPNIPKSVTDKLTTLSQWAAHFVVWAKEFMGKQTGEEKMTAVVDQLKAIAEEARIEATEDQLKAIVQTAYEAMKAGVTEVEPVQLQEAIAQPLVAPAVIINTGSAAVATDKVPDGALQQNPDGTVNAYNADGNKIGIVSEEEAERAASNVGVIITGDNG